MKKIIAILIILSIFALTACGSSEQEPTFCDLNPNDVICTDDTPTVDCAVTPDHEDCTVELDCSVTPNHEDCKQETDCDMMPSHPDCRVETDCEATPLHPDCLRIVDCSITPDDPVCEEVKDVIESCEVSGVTSCRYTLTEALPDGNYHEYATYQTMGDAQTIMYESENQNLVVLDPNEVVVTMKYGLVNFKTKPVTETTLLAQVGYSKPTYLNGVYNVDGLFLETDGIFTTGYIAGVKFEVLTSEVELIPSSQINNGYSYYMVKNNEITHTISQGIKTGSLYNMGAFDIAPDYLIPNIKYYSYDQHYFYTDIYTMIDDLRLDVRTNAVNSELPYYNYYQYLSFRSKTNYSKEELNSYINSKVGPTSGMYNTGEDFINAQENVFINAAMEMAFGIHESGWGNSAIAQDKNNLFGINAVDGDAYNAATSFDSVEDCIIYHVSYFLGARYFNPTYAVSFGTNFGNKQQGMNYKYASDAYWGEKIARHYYNLDKALGFKDYNNYKIGFLDKDTIGYYGPSTDSRVIYDSSLYNYYGLEIPFVIMDETDIFYVLQLPVGVNNDYELDFNEVLQIQDVFYVLKDDVRIIN